MITTLDVDKACILLVYLIPFLLRDRDLLTTDNK